MTTATNKDLHTYTTSSAPGLILPQKAGNRLWGPMLLMALMGFAVAFGLAIWRSSVVDAGTDPDLAAALGQWVPAAMFFGFAAVFAAISFAITRILGVFRLGGGGIQEAAGGDVKTLKMPATGKGFIAFMMMGMMVLLAAVVLHIIAGFAINGGDVAADTAEQWSIWLEAARRFGAAVYLFAIGLGLATIIQVLRFQSTRLRELVAARS